MPEIAGTLEDADEPGKILDKAKRRKNKPKVQPEIVMRRIRDVFVVMGISVVLAFGALIVLLIGLPKSEPAQLFTIFVLLGAAAVSVAAIATLGLISWGAYLDERVRSLEASVAAQELATNIDELMADLADRATRADICSRAKRVEPRLDPRLETQISEVFCERVLDVTAELAAQRLDYEVTARKAKSEKRPVAAGR